MKIEYTPKKFRPAALRIIRQADQICSDYAAQDYDLTVRQLYYQFVARGIIPNRDSEYQKLKGIVNDARLAGLLDWDHIVDRGRYIRSLPHWNDPTGMIRSAAQQFRTDKWARQPTRIEVWIEKDALIGVLDAVCPDHDISYFSCRGYNSQSEMWGAAQRTNAFRWAGQNVIILHLGDHDPSGIDMTRDMKDRLHLFGHVDDINKLKKILRTEIQAGRIDSDADDYKEKATAFLNEIEDSWGNLQVRRIALTMDQVEEHQPPPNPAKTTDSRYEGYIVEYGEESWELDALDPATLTALIQDEIESVRDDEVWDEDVENEDALRSQIERISDHWDAVNQWLDEREAS
jgi:hypothetical protein